MNPFSYDYAIIGAGCAGIHLAHAMMNTAFFKDKRIVVIEKELKDSNDRTWCFWESGSGNWDAILHHQWSKGKFKTGSRVHQLDMADYRYKMLRSIDFYQHGKTIIKNAPNFTWLEAEVLSIRDTEIRTSKEAITAHHIFDSRIPEAFFKKDDPYIRILQHFKGWVIETEEEVFDPKEFVMMDFRLQWKDSTSFTYVLPVSKKQALVEFTLFTPDLIEAADYDKMLATYIGDFLKIKNYKVTEIETGIIPMSDYPFHRHHEKNLTKIGTAGGWVRPSSGYSFKNCEKYAHQVVNNIRQHQPPSHGIAQNRFRTFDSIMLHVIKNENHLGKEIFSSMFAKNPAHLIFRFLDEETTMAQDLKIISGFRYAPFLKGLFRIGTRVFHR